MKKLTRICTAWALAMGIALVTAQTPPPAQEPAPTAPSEVRFTIRGESGAPPHYAVPDFVALTSDRETQDAARLIAEVLWADMAFEREYDMIPRDTYKTIDQAGPTDTLAFDRLARAGC